MMNDNENYLTHSDSIPVESVIEKQDKEIISTTINSSNVNNNYSENVLISTPNLNNENESIDYSVNNDHFSMPIQTTVITTEPCFEVVAIEDNFTKDFYMNKSGNVSNQYENDQILSEPDSLEEEYYPHVNNSQPMNTKIINPPTPYVSVRSSIKVPENKSTDRSLPSRSHSANHQKKKQVSSERCDFNYARYFPDISTKQPPANVTYVRSLFSQSINIFDPNNSYPISYNSRAPPRLQFYIKPYRGEPNSPTYKNQHRSRSIPNNRHEKQLSKALTRMTYRKQHVSWSPIREIIRNDEDVKNKKKSKRKKVPPRKENPSKASISINRSQQRKITSPIPIPIQFESPNATTHLSSSLSNVNHLPMKIINSIEQESLNNENKSENSIESISPDTLQKHKKTMKQYEQLLDKMRSTDKELQTLSHLWTKKEELNQPVKMDRKLNLLLNNSNKARELFSPMIVQVCFIALVIINLLVVYYFNEINLWWNA